MKIVTILGARPQFIKASVVSNVIKKTNSLSEIVIHTGQHFDENMSEIFFKELYIDKPLYTLGINGGNHGVMTAKMLEEIEKILILENPNIVLVYGDTNSTLAGALAAVKLKIPIAHIEAGLRSFNMEMPEEINRIITDRISSLLFTPTKIAKTNLLNEGTSLDKIFSVGDVMFDVALHYGKRAEEQSTILSKLNLQPKSYILATIHRAENTNNQERLKNIISGFMLYEKKIILPIHPRTHQLIKKIGLSIPKNIHLIEPVGYLDMVMLEKNALLIATDSGGVQKEAFFHKVPCVTLRNETEWIELIEAGWNFLVPPENPKDINMIINKAINHKGIKIQPYGKGKASEEIVTHLINKFNK